MVHRLRSSNRVSGTGIDLPARRSAGNSAALRFGRDSAFTLTEMLVSVAILAILGVVLLPSVDSISSQRLDSVARILAADMSLARSLAIQYNTQWAIQFDATNNQYNLVWTGSGASPPMPVNPHAIGQQTSGVFQVDVARLGMSTVGRNGVSYAGAAMKTSRMNVTDVTFGPLGSTGPLRSEDTVVWLTSGQGTQTMFSRVTVSWVTGQAWVDPPTMFTSIDQMFL